MAGFDLIVHSPIKMPIEKARMKVIVCSIQRNIDDHVHLLTSLRARSEVALSVLIVRSLSISFCLSCVMLVFCMQLHWIQRE